MYSLRARISRAPRSFSAQAGREYNHLFRASRELSVTSEWWWIATIIVGYQSMGLEDKKENLNNSWTLFVLVGNSWPICLASRPISSSEAMSKVDYWYMGFSKLECQRSEHLATFDGTVYMDLYILHLRPSHFTWPGISWQSNHVQKPCAVNTWNTSLFSLLSTPTQAHNFFEVE